MPDTIKSTTRTKVAFGDVVQLSKERSKDPEADGLERYIGLEHLEPSDLKVRSWGYIADGVTFTSVFRPGQVLFGKRRAYQRKVAVAEFSGVCSGDIYVLESKGDQLLPELLPFICQSEPFYDYVISMSQGGLSPRVNWKSLAKYEFDLPPLREQEEVLRKLKSIEDYLASNNAVADRLLAILPALRERYFSVGPVQKLLAEPDPSNESEIEERRRSYAGISSRRAIPRRRSAGYPSSVEPGIPVLPPLPAGWKRLKFGDVLNQVKRPAAIQEKTIYQLIVAKRYRAGIAAREELPGGEILTNTQFYVQTGDFLISRRQIIHGACGFVPDDLNGALVSNEYAVLNPTDLIDRRFLAHLSHTTYFQQTCFHASVGVALEKMIFSLDDWLNFEINLPPMQQQRQITKDLDQIDNGIYQADNRFHDITKAKQILLSREISGVQG